MTQALTAPEYGSLVVTIPRRDARVYVVAARRIRQILGKATAPDAVGLIRHELSGRTPKAVAEEYLYFIGWYDRQTRRRSGGRSPSFSADGTRRRSVSRSNPERSRN